MGRGGVTSLRTCPKNEIFWKAPLTKQLRCGKINFLEFFLASTSSLVTPPNYPTLLLTHHVKRILCAWMGVFQTFWLLKQLQKLKMCFVLEKLLIALLILSSRGKRPATIPLTSKLRAAFLFTFYTIFGTLTTLAMPSNIYPNQVDIYEAGHQ